MPSHDESSAWLLRIGFAAILIGWIDPLEGSLLILPGAGLVLWGTFGPSPQWTYVRSRASSLGLLAVGIAAFVPV